jgi:hypothetical protein
MNLRNFSFEQFQKKGEEVNAQGKVGIALVELDSGNIHMGGGVRIDVDAEDFIIDGETGYKTPLYDTIQLKNGISSLLNNSIEKKKLVSKKCREIALSYVSYKVFSENILTIYNSISSKS